MHAAIPLASKPCAECGATIELPWPEFSKVLFAKTNLCDDCTAKVTREEVEKLVYAAHKAALKRKAWEQICYGSFLGTDLARLPDANAAEEALRRPRDETLLVLHGPARTGKSRVAMLRAKAAYDRGLDVEYLGPGRLVELLARQYDQSGYYAEALHRLRIADVAVLDDALDGRLTEGAQNFLFAIIADRLDRKRPMIITTRLTGDAMANLFNGTRADAVVGRLREGATIAFRASKKGAA